MENEVEFNNGFVTALTLFYGHRNQWDEDRLKTVRRDLRLYCASDHLFDIEYPTNLDSVLKEEIEVFVKYVFDLRLKETSAEEVESIFDRCQKLVKEIDEKCFGLKVVVYYP